MKLLHQNFLKEKQADLAEMLLKIASAINL
jgi:hypothetical protein